VTRRVTLIGKPLKRRHSVVMHNAAFAAAGIDGEYVLAEIDEADVPGAVATARGPDSFGLGVTAPYKQLVAGLVDAIEGDAQTIGAVNNVVRTDDGRLIGINTDAPGFLAAAESAMGRSMAGARVVVAGAGGVAHAIVHACLTGGAETVTVASRNVERANALLARFVGIGTPHIDATALGSPRMRRALTNARLAVNATTVGMVDPGVTIDLDALGSSATVFDCVYVPADTPLLAAARARGLRAANGSEMLITQASIAFERWTGIGGMADVMRAAVAPLLADATVRA
jgi:shikimate dehydrogenase